MSGASTPKRSHDDGDSENERRVDKRARRAPSESDDRPLLPDSYPSKSMQAPVEHQPGAVRRVKLKNFVTYSAVEFFPGPSLNMVIGPNGTGKSTLVCAICIGMGYEPKLLGRAKEYSEFVKNGKSEAYIEIELQKPPNRATHPIFKCVLKRDGNKAYFSVDDRTLSQRQMKSRAAKLGIQIDNLCQFLPQDRVVEFSKLTPVELLHETQRAIASQEMLDWHDQLKECRKHQRKIENEKQDLAENLASLEAKHRMQEADVQRIRERDQMKANIEVLEHVRPILAMNKARKEATARAQDVKERHADLQKLEESMEPYLREIKIKQRYKLGMEAGVQQRSADLEQWVSAAEIAANEIRDLDRKIDRQVKKREHETGKAKAANSNRKSKLTLLTNLRSQKAQPPPITDSELGILTTQIRRLEHEQMENHDSRQENRNKGITSKKRADMATKDAENARKEAEALKSKAGKQAQKLRRMNIQAFQAYQWLQNNQSLFKETVYGPPLVECSVRNPALVDMVESALGQSDLQSFTAQNEDDYRLLVRSFRENNLSRTNQRYIEIPLAQYQERANQGDLGSYGLDGWLLDLIEGPEPVLAALCEGAKIHLTPYASRDLDARQFEGLRTSNIGRVVTSKTSYQFTRRREYGPNATNVITRRIGQARFWSDTPVDTAAISDLLRKANEREHDAKMLEEEYQTLRGNDPQYTTRAYQLDSDIKRMKQERDDKTKQLRAWVAIDTRIAATEKAISDFEEIIRNHHEQDIQLSRESDGFVVQRLELALAYADAIEAVRVAQDELQDAEIMRIEAISDWEVLEQRDSTFKEELTRIQDEITSLEAAHKAARGLTKRLHDRVHTMLQTLDTDAREKIRETKDRISEPDALEAELESEKARFELMQSDNHGNTLAEYERRAKQIESLRTTVNAFDAGLSELSGKIAEIRQSWEPQLDSLIGLVSRSFVYNMGRINCAGEVAIHKDEDDFDQWAIKIMVKFRASEELSQLDSHRQSGGERAVSTIFYLMSLQTMARSPFRVVDEINQGMDPRNERMVHARMVAIATGTDDMPAPVLNLPKTRRERDGEEGEDGDGEDGEVEDEDAEEEEVDPAVLEELTKHKGSQYFLITPKLLPDLKYECGMRVLCIASGEHMPSPDAGGIDFRRQLEIRRSLMATAAG